MKTDRDKILKEQRELMIKEHLIARGIKDRRVLDAMEKIPREKFVPEKFILDSYGDHPLPIGHNQTISQPYIVALMSELCELKGSERVLEIGSGSGYQAAILSMLSGHVYTIERIKNLAENAEKILNELECKNVEVIYNDGYNGLPAEAPFDVIILTAAPDKIPQTLIDQLSENGRLVAPVGDSIQQLVTLRKKSGIAESDIITYVSFVPMLKGFN